MSRVVSAIRNLQRRNPRRRERRAVLEGVRLVEEAVASGLDIHGILMSPTLERTERGRNLASMLRDLGAPLECVADRELAAAADTTTPQGVIAVTTLPSWTLADVPVRRGAPVAVLDGLQDPGNVGTVLRTSQALGAAGVILLRGTAQLANPKVLRASMGAPFRFPVVSSTDQAWFEWMGQHEIRLWVASVRGETIRGRPRPNRLAIVIGNEGAGVRPAIEARANALVRIPLHPDAESLNVSAAAAILLYEVTT